METGEIKEGDVVQVIGTASKGMLLIVSGVQGGLVKCYYKSPSGSADFCTFAKEYLQKVGQAVIRYVPPVESKWE